MQQDKIGPLTKREVLSVFLIAGGLALVIAGRFLSLQPEWFWFTWQKDIILHINQWSLNAYVSVLYDLGLIIIAAGFLVSAKSLLDHIKHHLLFYGLVTTAIGASLIAVLTANSAYTFTYANDVQKYLSLTWLVRALYIEFFALCLIFTVTGITLLSAFGLTKGYSKASMKNIKNDVNEYLAIIKEPIQSNKKTVIGLILAVCGFTYLLIGAWPDAPQMPDYPEGPYFWQWQRDLATLGNPVVWTLYLISFAAFAIGCFLLYQKIRQK